jgi:transmembrane sensor
MSMNNERTLQGAARRYARLHADDCAQSERDEVERWRTQDAKHRDAYALAAQVAVSVDRMAADAHLQEKLRALADEAFAAYEPAVRVQRSRERNASRRWHFAVGVAASVAIAALAWHIQRFSARSVEAVVHATSQHERRRVTLDDGSVVELDVGTRIEVSMSRDRRRIDLLAGRALFDVAHDSSRPFSVTAEGSRTTALGTRFQVQRDDDRVVVTLADGSVAIEQAQLAAATGSWQEHLTPGEQLTIDAATSRRQREFVDTQIITSWTHGRHVFRGTPLREALDEVNRYVTRKVRLGDPSLAEMTVAGNFIAGDSEIVVEAFATMLPLRVVRSGKREIVLFRRYGE